MTLHAAQSSSKMCVYCMQNQPLGQYKSDIPVQSLLSLSYKTKLVYKGEVRRGEKVTC